MEWTQYIIIIITIIIFQNNYIFTKFIERVSQRFRKVCSAGRIHAVSITLDTNSVPSFSQKKNEEAELIVGAQDEGLARFHNQ